MVPATPNYPRLITTVLIALVLLLLMLWATGGGFQSAPPPPTPQPTALPTTNVNPIHVSGHVTASAAHVAGSTWRFIYTVRDNGTSPIAGFQLNGPIAHLGAVHGPRGWLAFGGGICQQKYPGILAYWSVNSASARVIHPGQSAVFSFLAATPGTGQDGYSLSWGNAAPQFGKIVGPAESTLPAPAACK